MSEQALYDRALLLGGAKRDAILDLWEVQRYGSDSFGDGDYVSIYGMRPADWHAKGVRVLGRTAVECTRDGLGDAIGKDVAAIATTRPPTARTVVVDPFVGSGNTLYWLLRHLPVARTVGFEADAGVFRLTKTSGLDLRRTTPPITEIVDVLVDRFSPSHLLCVIQIYEIVLSASIAELRARFDWSTQSVYGLDTPGQNHGILVGAKHWVPLPATGTPSP